MDLIVHNENDGTARTTDGVGESTLEESSEALSLEDNLPAVGSVLVEDLGLTGLHHHTTTNGVKGVGDNTSDSGNDLGNHPLGKDRGVLGEEETLSGIVTTEEGGTVNNDTVEGNHETTVETTNTVLLGDLLQAVTHTSELTLVALTHIGGETSTGKVKRVNNEERSGTSSTTRGQVTEEELPRVGLLVDASQEHLLVSILESKVQSLGREVTNNVGEVTTPEGEETLLLRDTTEGITHTLVSLFDRDLKRDHDMS